MISIEKVTQISNSLESSIFELIERSMSLERSLSECKKNDSTNEFNLLKATLEMRIEQLQLNIKEKEKVIQLKDDEYSRLNQKYCQLAQQNQDLKVSVNSSMMKIEQREGQLLQAQTKSQCIPKLELTIEQLNLSLESLHHQAKYSEGIIQSLEAQLTKIQESIHVKDDNLKLKEMDICQKCKSSIDMILYHKQRQIIDLRKSSQDLNEYINQISADPVVEKKIISKLIEMEINRCLVDFEKETNRQFYIYTVCNVEDREKVIKNLGIYLRNLKKEICYAVFGKV